MTRTGDVVQCQMDRQGEPCGAGAGDEYVVSHLVNDTVPITKSCSDLRHRPHLFGAGRKVAQPAIGLLLEGRHD